MTMWGLLLGYLVTTKKIRTSYKYNFMYNFKCKYLFFAEEAGNA